MAPKPGWTELVLGWASNPVLIHELEDSGGMSKVVVASLLCSEGFLRVLSFLPSFALWSDMGRMAAACGALSEPSTRPCRRLRLFRSVVK